jgi:hypothetical protein
MPAFAGMTGWHARKKAGAAIATPAPFGSGASARLRSQPRHLLFQTQFLQFHAGYLPVIRPRPAILLMDARIQLRVTFFQDFDVRLQAHIASLKKGVVDSAVSNLRVSSPGGQASAIATGLSSE